MTNMTTDPEIIKTIDAVLGQSNLLKPNKAVDGDVITQNGLVIVGPHRCGKDLVANIISTLTPLIYWGSLSAGCTSMLVDVLLEAGVIQDSSESEFYENRHQYSGYIKHILDTIRNYNPVYVLNIQNIYGSMPDIVTGVRTVDEIKILNAAGNKFIWVERGSLDDPTLDYTYLDLLSMCKHVTCIQNKGTKWDLVAAITKCKFVNCYDLEVRD